MAKLEIAEILAAARLAKAQSGRPVRAQLFEMARLRIGPGKIRPHEYFDYRLFEPSLTHSQRLEFVGNWVKAEIYQAQDPQWMAVGNDKLLSYAFLGACGLPVERVKAVAEPCRFYPNAALLHSAQAMSAWLRDPANYPFFAKPAASAFGRGACYGERYDAGADTIVSANDECIDVAGYVEAHWDTHIGGLLFQDVIVPHAELVRLFGRRVGTVRILTLCAPNEPRIHRAALRIPVGDNFTDNLRHGLSGNCFAPIDIETGRLIQGYAGFGLTLKPIAAHPDTGTGIAGFKLPCWPEVLEVVKTGQRALAGLRIVGWDIAITDDGPIVVEFNTHTGFALVQAYGQGFADAAFRSLFPRDAAESARRHRNIQLTVQPQR